MKRNACLLPMLASLFLIVAGFGLAQTTYEDPQGRYVIDIPKGWQLAPQTDEKVFVFQGEGKSIIIECVPGVNDTAALLKKAETTVRLSGMAKPVLDGGVTEMSVNGLPARWCVYKGTLSGASLAALSGGVALGEDGLYFLSFISVTETASWKGKLEKSFQSIRGRGQKLTGVEVGKTSGASATPAVTATPWASDLVSLSLPPGWAEKPKPRGFEKEVKGWFMSDNLPGATLMVVCYKGAGLNMGKALEAGIKSMTIPNPGLKPESAQEIVLENGKINFVVLKGMVAAGGTEVELASVITVFKADKCYVDLILTGMSSLLPELKNQALEIAKTLK